MKSVPIHLAKAQLSRLVDEVAGGDEVIITRRGKPVAMLVPLALPQGRVLGRLAGQMRIPDDFDDPLPDDVLRLFLGK